MIINRPDFKTILSSFFFFNSKSVSFPLMNLYRLASASKVIMYVVKTLAFFFFYK